MWPSAVPARAPVRPRAPARPPLLLAALVAGACAEAPSWGPSQATVALEAAGAAGGLAAANRNSSQVATRALLARRRLWFWPENEDLANAAKDTTDWVEDTSKHVADQVTTNWNAVTDIFKEAEELIKQLLGEGQKLMAQSTGFGDTMKQIYNKFEPLEEVFAAQHGMVALLGSKERLATLVNCVEGLLGSAGDIGAIANSIALVQDMFVSLGQVLEDTLSKLEARRLGVAHGRRLSIDDIREKLLGSFQFDAWKDVFEQLTEALSDVANTLTDIDAALSPLLQKLSTALAERRLLGALVAGTPLTPARAAARNFTKAFAGARRLKFSTAKVKEDHSQYQDAIKSVMPTWTRLEDSAKDVCGKSRDAIGQVQSLQCRIKEFVQFPDIPGVGQVGDLVGKCDEQTSSSMATTEICPDVSYSTKIKDALSSNAGFIGVVCLTIEYAITYGDVTRTLFAIFFFFLPGLFLAVFGYRYKDTEFWIEGFLSGMVLFGTGMSVLIVWYGVCRGVFISSCDPGWVFAVIVILSVIWAFVVVKGEMFQLFFAGFDLGCLLGGVAYLAEEFDRIRDSVLDIEAAKQEMIMMLTGSVLCGIILGTITLYFAKFAIVLGTSAIGALLVVIGGVIVSPLVGLGHPVGTWDFVAVGVWTALAVVVQYKYTCPAEGNQDGNTKPDDDNSDNKALIEKKEEEVTE